MAIDGLAIVLSRVTLLDTSLMLFVLLGFWFVLLDRERTLAAHRGGARRARDEDAASSAGVPCSGTARGSSPRASRSAPRPP